MARKVQEKKAPEKKADDLFDAIEDLFQGRTPEKIPQPFILHRFLGSDMDYCIAAKEIQHAVSEPDMVFGIWSYAVPRGRAPRLSYVGPKKAEKAEKLVERMMVVDKINREDAEQIVELLALRKIIPQVCTEYGID